MISFWQCMPDWLQFFKWNLAIDQGTDKWFQLSTALKAVHEVVSQIRKLKTLASLEKLAKFLVKFPNDARLIKIRKSTKGFLQLIEICWQSWICKCIFPLGKRPKFQIGLLYEYKKFRLWDNWSILASMMITQPFLKYIKKRGWKGRECSVSFVLDVAPVFRIRRNIDNKDYSWQHS